MEKWKLIEGANYLISDFGNIKNLNTDRVLKKFKTKKGYERIRLVFKDKRKKGFFIHRLVANYFLDKSNGDFVNHINGIRDDNRLCNLEWINAKDNINHAKNITKNFRMISSKKIKALYNSNLSIEEFYELLLENCK